MSGFFLRQRVHKWVRKKKLVRLDKREYQKTSTWLHHFDFKPKYLTLKYLNNYQFELSTHSRAAFLNWIHSTSHLVYYFICTPALYYAMLNFRWIDRYLSQMQLHHLPPGIFDKNTQLVQLWVKLFFRCDARVKIIQYRKLNNINKICKSFIHNM